MELYVTTQESRATDAGTDIVLYCRDENSNPRTVTVSGYLPYFYATTAEVRPIERDLLAEDGVVSLEDGYESVYGDSLTRIVVRKRGAMYDLKDRFDQTFEADVWDGNRFRIDHEVYTGIEVPRLGTVSVEEVRPSDFTTDLRVCTFDIETDDRGAFPNNRNPTKRIISVVAHDSFTDEYFGFFDTDGRPITELFPNGRPDGLDELRFYASEPEMLAGFATYLQETDVDVLSGWNTLKFDAPYMVGRMNYLSEQLDGPLAREVNADRLARDGGWTRLTKKGEARIPGRIVYDMLPAYKSAQRRELSSFRLDAVAEAELGEKKLDYGNHRIWDLYRTDADTLMRYNYHDVRLVVAINDATGVLEFRKSLAEEVGVDLEQTNANNQFIEMLVRRELFERGVAGPTAQYREKESKYTGAFVVKAFRGLARHVVGMDLASLYPYTMAMLNASPETRVPDVEVEWDDDGPYFWDGDSKVRCSHAPNGAVFRLDREGVFTGLVNKAIGLKADYKVERDKHGVGSPEYELFDVRYNVSKTITNSLYGTTGWVKFFMYDELTAEAVTTLSQVVIKTTQAEIDDYDSCQVIYGDTDSNYVQFTHPCLEGMEATAASEFCVSAAHGISSYLNDSAYVDLAGEWGMADRDCLWEIEVESYASTFFQAGKKKRYAMRVLNENGKATDKLKIVGFDTNRSDTAVITEELQKSVLEAICYDTPEEEISELVYEAGRELRSTDLDFERVGIPQGIKKELSEYDVPGAHVRGAMYANSVMRTNYGSGSKPMRVYVEPAYFDETGSEPIDVLCFEESAELPDSIRLDVATTTEKLLVKPLRPILEAVGIEVDAALKGQTQMGLDQFF